MTIEKTKNIILLDVHGNYVNSLLCNENIVIKAMIIDSKKDSILYKNKYGSRIENFYYRIPKDNTEYNDLNKTDYQLSYEEIEDYRSTQLKVEHYLHREILDANTIQYRYFTALAFWLDFFNKNNIDMVFAAHIEHGAVWDSIIIDIAKKKNIPVYTVSITSGVGNQEIDTLVRLNDNKFVDVQKFNFNTLDTKNYLELLNKRYVTKESKDCSKDFKKNFSRIIKKTLLNLKNNSNILKDFQEKTQEFKYWYNLTKEEILENEKYLANIKLLYDKISEKPNKDDKYIYFSLHLEPEASIMARSVASTQLFLIKWLSDTLPNDWKIYVKDHPAQYKLNGYLFYLLRNIKFYRNYDFFKTLIDIPKVKLIGLEYNSDELVENSKAVASISGSVAIKTITEKKPLILFGQGLNVMENLKEVFVIDSMAKLRNAIGQICNGYTPTYTDLDDVIKKYIFYLPSYCMEKNRDVNKKISELFKELTKDENRV